MKHLTDKQIEKFSEVLIAIGEVLFGSIIARAFFGIEKKDLFMLILGLTLSICCFGLSIVLVRKIKK